MLIHFAFSIQVLNKMKFEELGLSPKLLETIKKLGFTNPTDIQEKSISNIINGKDVIGESATGSGKTLAFGCGIVEKVIQGKGIQALVLTPTRELADQVKNSLRDISAFKGLNTIAIYGGVSINNQIRNIPRAEVIISTPGRMLDHLQRRTIDISKVKILVLDEADRMFDMGFIDDVEKIIRQCPNKRQTLFFSATISERVKKLAHKFMVHPVQVFAENMVDPSKLKQFCYNLPQNMKLSLLVHLLKSEKSGLVMVFCNTRTNTDFVVKNLRNNDIKAIGIHGGLSQNKRNYTMSSFNNARVNVLVCTDVASRGLHIENVSHIYNYDIPKDPKDYVHRIGRTARAGSNGKVINILSPRDYPNYDSVLREYNNFIIEKVKVPELPSVNVSKPAGRNYQQRPGNFQRRNQGNFSRRPQGGRDSRRPSYNNRRS